jgi:hypothetical protein
MRRSERKRTDPDLGVLASRLLFAIQDELFATLADRGFADLRPQHGAVLAYLDTEGSRATDLAVDRRAKLVVPTARGRRQMTSSDAILAAIERRHGKAVGTETYNEFKRVFREVADRQRARTGSRRT